MHILQQSTALNHIRILSKVRKAMITIRVCCIVIKAYVHELIDSIFVSFGVALFQQVVGIPMGTNCAPLPADLFLCSYESEFLQDLVKDKKIHEARAFNFTYRYIDDVLSINNPRFAEFLPLIYPPEL